MKLERYQIYGLIGAAIFFVVLLWPRIYDKKSYYYKLAGSKVELVYGLKGFVKKWEKLGRSIPRFIIPVGSKVIVPQGLPLWRIILDAPQYPRTAFPEGLLVNIYINGPANGCKHMSCLHEIDTINHYIGMQSLSIAAPVMSRVGTYLALLMFIGLLVFIFVKRKLLGFLVVLPLATPFLFLVVFSYWTHWLGYNLNPWASFKVHSFTPILYGVGKVAQFSTHNRPAIGFTLLMVSFVFIALSYLSKRKYLKQKGLLKNEKKSSVAATADGVAA